jgi:hypothetical protein
LCSTHISADTLFEIERVSCRINNLDLFISGTKHEYDPPPI